MNQNRKDQDRANRPSNSERTKGSGSVLGSKESFEHGSGTSEMARGMGSSGERGSVSEHGSSGSGSGISNRGADQERSEQNRVPERGRSKSST